MFVRCKMRRKDGKEHRYWSVVENVRVRGGRVVQRQVLYLGEINDSQRAAWCRSIALLDETAGARQLALFPADRAAPALDCEVVQIRVTDVQVRDPRQWGACWLALTVWDRLALDRFWGPRLPASRDEAAVLPTRKSGCSQALLITPKQLTVRRARPACGLHGADLVSRQLGGESTRQILVKQNAHGQEPNPEPDRARRAPVASRPTGTDRGNWSSVSPPSR